MSRDHYEDDKWVLRVFWQWAKYTGDQASCATALSALWTKVGKATFLGLINDCKNGPLEVSG